MDQRFSGTEPGIYCRILMHKRLGKLDPDGGMEDYWKAYKLVKSVEKESNGESDD